MVLENINQDLISYYPLNETSGNRADPVGSNTLTDVNTVGSTTGKINTAAVFVNANTEELVAADATVFNFDGTEDFTIACWAWVDNLSPPGSDQFIFSKFADDNGLGATDDDRQYGCFFDASTDQFRAIISETGTSNSADVSPANNITANTWFFLVMEYEASSKTLTLTQNNGTGGDTDSASATNAIINQSAIEFTIGNGTTSTGDAFLDGRVDELAVWNRLLTSTEKSELYNSGAGVNLLDFIPVDVPPAFIGGYLEGLPVLGASGFIGGYIESRGFLSPQGDVGGFLFGKTPVGQDIFAIVGGFLGADAGSAIGPAAVGGFCLSLPVTPVGPTSIGGAMSGLREITGHIGGYIFGRPDFTNFVAARGRTVITATSRNVNSQDLNIDAEIIFKGINTADFNAKLDNIKTFQNDIIATVTVEKFKIPPSVFITSIDYVGASGEIGPLNKLGPDGARQVCVTASGRLNDGDQFVSAHIDFSDPFRNELGSAYKPHLSVSGFTGPPPWTACHDYDMSGIYQVTARAQDNLGMVGMALSGVSLASGLTPGIHYPVISISGDPRFGEVPTSLKVDFTLESSGLMSPQFTSKEINNSLVQSPTDERILWQFGNRERSSKKNPFTFYQSPGLFAPKVMYKFNHPSGFGQLMVSDSLLLGFVR